VVQPLTADDLLPLVAKLPHDEQVRLAQLALRAARDVTRDAAAYRATPRRGVMGGRGVGGGRCTAVRSAGTTSRYRTSDARCSC